MAEDFDIEALLEAPYNEDVNNTDKSSPIHVSSNGKKRENGKHRSRSRSRSKDKERDRERKRSDRDKEKKSSRRSRSRDKKRSRSKERKRSRSRSKDKKRSKSRERKVRSKSKELEKSPDRSRDRHRSDRERVERERERERSERDRPERERPERERPDRERSERDRPGRERPERERPEKDRPEKDRPEKDRPEKDRSDRDRPDKDRPEKDRPEKDRSDRDRLERDRERPEKDRKRDRSRSKEHRRRRSSRSPDRRFRRGRTPPNSASRAYSRSDDEIDLEERDARTIFCMQLSQRVRARDLEEFFSSVGKVRDVRLITCNKTKRFKGIAYIEFKNSESVALALGLNGQKLLGIPISVQHTQAEKNRIQNAPPVPQPQKNPSGPMRLYVGSLHFNITEDMLRGIFEPFGKIDSIQLIMDSETGRSKGYGFITFHNAEDAKKALEQLNGFELAGRPMKVGNVTERLDVNTTASLDTDEMDRSGIDLGVTGRLQLMFKLAEGAGLDVPQAAANALLATAPQPQIQPQIAPPIATQCFLLSNMFDPITETNPLWDIEIRDEVVEECQKHGGILHVYVDKASQGNVYVKCPSIATAVLAVNALHGRWFAGRVITAAYVPLLNYHALFPDAATAANLLQTSAKE
ncbi:RNA-binding protein 39 isoform X3 [Contarinia nasturtii]|uniref:RNA-binding protein 39 isoform X3 n=1 Tax=Contarinia nasturtii TaxID=265458 RepID=UPI0012D426C8|nr:RNA-binding protein 39 isoform X3 [Contarinia nasturtii]